MVQPQSQVNWVSVITFLENEYSKSTLRQKEWYLQKKVLQDQISSLKGELMASQQICKDLFNRIKLLQMIMLKEKIKNNKIQQKQKSSSESLCLKNLDELLTKHKLNSKIQAEHSHEVLNKVMADLGLSIDKLTKEKQSLLLRENKQKSLNNFRKSIEEISKVQLKQKAKFGAHLDSVRGIYVDQDDNFIVSVSQDCLLKVWSLQNINSTESIEPTSVFRQHTGQLFALSGGKNNQNNNQTLLFSGGSEEYVKIWHKTNKDKTQNVKCIGYFLNSSKQEEDNLKNSEQQNNEITWQIQYKANKILTSASDGIVRLFNITTALQNNQVTSNTKHIYSFKQKSLIQTTICWVGQQGFLSGIQNSPKILLWDIETNKIMQKYLYEIDKGKQAIYFQTNAIKYVNLSKQIISGCEDSHLRVFDYNSNKLIKKLQSKQSIGSVQTYKNNYILAGCHDGNLRMWDNRTFKLLFDQKIHSKKYQEGIHTLKSNKMGVFSGGSDGIINFFTT